MVQNVVDTKILGSLTHLSQWKLPMSVKGDQVSKVSFSNKKTRLAIDNVAHLISFTFSAPEDDKKKRIWIKLIQDYRDAMNILQKCTEFTAEDIRLIQVKINDFFLLTLNYQVQEKKVLQTVTTCLDQGISLTT